MIVAIEGPSAAGKTTWCRNHFADRFIAEAPENIAAPDLSADPAQIARFWVNHNIERWQSAVELERSHGIVFCDGDPFHLYYSWALWKSGTLPRTLFDLESQLYRNAFYKKRLGFVDHVLWLQVPVDELRRRNRADPFRRRKHHELYLALAPWMQVCFQHRESFMPGTVHDLDPGLRVEQLMPSSWRRYDAALAEQLLFELSVQESSSAPK
jgi:hypothetical protein